MKQFLLVIITVILFAKDAGAQQPVLLSLNDCMDYAMKHNYAVKNAKLDVAIQEAQVAQQVSAAYPHINGKVEFDKFIVPQQSFIDASSFSFPGGPVVPKGTIEPIAFTLPYAASANISASQTLFDGAVLVALKAKSAAVELAKVTGDVTNENIRYNIFKAYSAIVITRKQVVITSNQLAYTRSMERDAIETQKSGMMEKIDVERSSVQTNNLVSDSISLQNNLDYAEKVLKYQLGMDVNTDIVLTDTTLENENTNALSLIAQEIPYETIPEYQQVKASLTLYEYNVQRYKLAGIPSLSMFYSQGSNYGSTRFSDMWYFRRYWASSTFGIQLNVPIFNGWLRTNQLKEAQLNVEKANNNIANVKLGMDFSAASSRTTLKNAMLTAQNQKKNMELADDVLDLARRKYKAGVGSNIEVTQAQQDQLRAQSGYYNALLNTLNAEADLRKVLGLFK